MSAVALGRLLARRLAEEGGGSGEPVTVQDLRRRLVPYRLCRVELDLATKAEYDLAVLALLSEPELVAVRDEALRDAVARELASAEPELDVLRAFDTSLVDLGPELSGGRARKRPVRDRSGEARAAAPPPGADAPEPEAAEEPEPPNPAPEAEMRAEAEPAEEPAAAACRACGAVLPQGREARFCPWCGADQRPPRCASCGEELETDWRYCPACGRAAAPEAADA